MFATKSEYLTWRSEWRAHYKTLTTEIRQWKAKRKGKPKFIMPSAHASYCNIEQAHAQYQCWILRIKAREMLEKRKESKLLAQRLYLAAKSTPIPASA